MVSKGLAVALSGATLMALATSGASFAQSTASTGTVYGPPIAGVCVFDRNAAINSSQAGISANQQITQFSTGMRAELGAQHAAIVRDDHALAQRRPSMSVAAYQQSVAQIRQRYQALDQTAKARDAQLRRTSDYAVKLVDRALEPALSSAVTQRRCALVIERKNLEGANPAMDITPAVVSALNLRLPILDLRLAP